MSNSHEFLLSPGARLPEQPALTQPAPFVPPANADVIVVGAGVIGLSIGWRLAQAGLRTVVLERDLPGHGASLAATGMLAAAAELEAGGEALLPFALASQRLWPDFSRELEACSCVPLDYSSEGTLVVALTRDETDRLRSRFDLHTRSGLGTKWMTGAEARRLEPGLRSSATAALWCADDHQVDPRRLVPALRLALAAAGGRLAVPCDAVSILHEAGRCAGVVTSTGECRAPVVILATGAWGAAGSLAPDDTPLPLRPVKGQSLALRTSRAAPGPRRVIWTEQVHLAAKADGRMIVGATVEEAGFDSAITAGGVFALLEGARRAIPAMEDMAVEAIWCGFRPTSDDDAPILGPSSTPGLLLAIGHHRNGVLLAPATAEAIAQTALGREPPPSSLALALSRFRRTG